MEGRLTSDVCFAMIKKKSRWNMEHLWISESAKAVMEALGHAGISSWVVGGPVRDLLRGEIPQDWDLAAAATPEEMKHALSRFSLVETGIQHGTITVLIDHTPVEVTACRGEGAYHDRRHPDSVTFHRSIEEDLARRDFTINAMAYSPDSGLLDPFGGMQDLKAGVIRCIRNPQDRFLEDALRILRALRFASVLGYRIEEKTAAAIHTLAGNLEAISAERCAAEFSKLILGENAVPVLQEFADVVAVILPAMRPMLGFYHREEHGGDLWRHSTAPLACAPKKLPVRLALMLRDCAKPVVQLCGEDYPGHAERGAEMTEEALRRLKFPVSVIRQICVLVRYHSALPQNTDSAILRALHELGEETFLDLMDMREADRCSHGEDTSDIALLREHTKELIARGACYQLSQLALSGEDLKALGYRGREIGENLKTLLDAVIEGRCENTRDTLLACLRM